MRHADNMRKQWMELMDSFDKMDDPSKTPMAITAKALYDGLTKGGLKPELAAKVVGSMKVEVNESFTEDKELFDRTIDVYVRLVFRIKNWAETQVHPDFFLALLNGTGLSIKYIA